MSGDAHSKSGKVWLYAMGLALGLPLLYVLSAGPAAVLIFRGLAPKSVESVLLTLYLPLRPFAEATKTEGLLQAYVEVWLNATGTDFRPPIK